VGLVWLCLRSWQQWGRIYDTGRLRPEMLNDIEKIIYVLTDSHNVTVETLQEWEILPSRRVLTNLNLKKIR